MPTRTSAQSGLWSSPSTWQGGVVPQNGDDVVISAGHTVTFDVDQSGFADGLAGIVVNGTLTCIADGTKTHLETYGDISGSGSIYWGTQANPIPPTTDGSGDATAFIELRSTARFTGNYANLEFWGEQRAPSYPIASKPNNQTVVLAGTGRLEWLRAGDRVGISNSTIYGRNSPPDETFIVQSYDPDTRTITLHSSTPLTRAVNQNQATDHVMLLTRSIRLWRASGSGSCFSAKHNGILRGVWLRGFNPAPVDGRNGWLISHCTAQNNTYGGMAYWGSSHSISNCTAQNNTNGGIAYGGADHSISSCTAQNNTHGGMAYLGGNHSISNCTAQNNTNGGIVASGTNYSIFGCAVQNNTEGGIVHWSVGCIISACTAQNNTSGGIARAGILHSISNCQTSGNTGAGLAVGTAALVARNCVVQEAVEVGNYTVGDIHWSRPSVDSWDHDGTPGNRRIWCKGGVVFTVSDVVPPGQPRSYRHLCESAQFPVFSNWPIVVRPQELIRIRVWLRKDRAMTYLPRVWLIDPAQDPFLSDSYVPLVEWIMTDSVDSWEGRILTWRNTANHPRELVLRSVARNATGYVWFAFEIVKPATSVWGALR